MDAEGDFTTMPAAVEVAAYRIAIEAVTNVARHSDATSCLISMQIDGDLRLQVSDNGKGISTDAVPHVGLSSMRERADELGGECEILNELNGGTTVRARLPIPKVSDVQ